MSLGFLERYAENIRKLLIAVQISMQLSTKFLSFRALAAVFLAHSWCQTGHSE